MVPGMMPAQSRRAAPRTYSKHGITTLKRAAGAIDAFVGPLCDCLAAIETIVEMSRRS